MYENTQANITFFQISTLVFDDTNILYNIAR